MLFADRRHLAELYQAADHPGCEVGAVRVVADVRGQLFVATVWSLEASLDGYPGHIFDWLISYY